MSSMIRSAQDHHAAATAVSRAPRPDLYSTIHKALRQFMTDTLGRVGRMDVDDDSDRNTTLDQVDLLLQQLRSHLQHENDFVHTAIDARRPGGARITANDHGQHLESMRNLDDEVQALRQARDFQRPALAQRLYSHLAIFVAENFEHMLVEERDNNATLWALYSDAELAGLHGRILAHIAPDEMARTVRWMAAAMNPQELAGMFTGMRQNAPAAAFEAMLDIVRQQLDTTRWAKLARALGLPPVPGLVTV